MDTVILFLNIHSCTDVLNNSLGLWKPNKKKNPTKYTAAYNGVHFTYIPDKFYLSIKFSATKLLYSTNVTTLDIKDINLITTKLNSYIPKLLNKAPNAKEWMVSRLDLVANFYCGNLEDVKRYLKALKQISYSRCFSSGEFETSIHMHNNSVTINIYIKHAQDSSADKRILRIEFQLKNATLNRLVKKGLLPSKKFGDILENLDVLNTIYKNRLDALGLNKRFLTKSQMEVFLTKLHKKGEISNARYKNMYSFFIEGNKSISSNTIYNYKKLLAKYGISHIISEKQITNNIDFYNFNLYINKITKPKNSFKIYTLLFLFVMPSIFIALILSIISNSIILFKNNSTKIIFDDS